MRKVYLEISAEVIINQTMTLTDEEFSILEDGTDKQVYKILEPKISFDCITEVKDINIWDLEEEEND